LVLLVSLFGLLIFAIIFFCYFNIVLFCFHLFSFYFVLLGPILFTLLLLLLILFHKSTTLYYILDIALSVCLSAICISVYFIVFLAQ